jgi:hypothetical protein
MTVLIEHNCAPSRWMATLCLSARLSSRDWRQGTGRYFVTPKQNYWRIPRLRYPLNLLSRVMLEG